MRIPGLCQPNGDGPVVKWRILRSMVPSKSFLVPPMLCVGLSLIVAAGCGERHESFYRSLRKALRACTSKLWRIVVISGGQPIARVTTFGCCIVLLVGVYAARGQQSTIPKDALKVRIDTSKKQFHVGDPLQFSIMITNVGSQSFLVPNRVSLMDDTMSILDVDLRTRAGQYFGPWQVLRLRRI
jgi:hypothetical protein